MVSVTDVVSVTSASVGDECVEVEAHFDDDNEDTHLKLVSKTDGLNDRQFGADEDVPLVIRITQSETRDDDDDVDGGAIEEENKADARENNLSNEASDKKKKKRKKPKTKKSSKMNSKANGAVDNTLISPQVDDMIDNMIYTCDPLFEANYKGAFDALIQFDVANEEPSERGDDDTDDDEDVQSKIDRILSLGGSSEKDDASDYDKFDLHGLPAIVKQKREIDDLVLSKGLVDAELQDTKEKLRNAKNVMEELQQSNDELHEKVQRLESRLDNKEKKAEHAVRKEQEMSQNYMNDLDDAHSAIEYQKEQRHNDLARHRKAMADLTFALDEETRKNDELNEEILLLKQQLIAEKSKRYCVEELVQEKDSKNEQLSSELHKRERYCFELEHTMKMTKKSMQKDYKDLLKVNENLGYKLSSSKEKLKRSRRERNELQFRMERLSNSLRVDTNIEIMKFEGERESNAGMEGGIDDDIFLIRQNQRMERLKSIMS